MALDLHDKLQLCCKQLEDMDETYELERKRKLEEKNAMLKFHKTVAARLEKIKDDEEKINREALIIIDIMVSYIDSIDRPESERVSLIEEINKLRHRKSRQHSCTAAKLPEYVYKPITKAEFPHILSLLQKTGRY